MFRNSITFVPRADLCILHRPALSVIQIREEIIPMATIIVSTLDSNRIRESIMDLRRNGTPIPKEVPILLEELNKATVVEPKDVPSDVVTMHSRIRLKYLDTDKTIEFELVYPAEADVKQQRISIFSPVATAMIGFREGDEVEWAIPTGMAKLRIEKVLFQPEAAGDLDL